MMTKRAFLLTIGGAAAAASVEGWPGRAAGLPLAFQPVHDLMAAQVAVNKLPGAVWLVAQGDEVVVDAVGVSAIGSTVPMRRDTIFRLASMTKAITATAVMMLVEDGKVALDVPAQRWLPELADRHVLQRIDGSLDDTVPARRAITVQDLLTSWTGSGACARRPRGARQVDLVASEELLGRVAPGTMAFWELG